MDFILQPWPWYVAGPLIALTLFLYFFFGKNFGVSSNFETICSIVGMHKFCNYFEDNWKKKKEGLFFLVGLIVGGTIAANFLIPSQVIDLNPKTIEELTSLGFKNAGNSFLPDEIYGLDTVLTFKGFMMLIGSGFLIGFGTRYAGGCTSGHAITGISSLQLPSLLATIGFFIGGLLMTWVLIPLIFG
ncbi:YeeE/YedE family protein [Tenacibaculum sp. IB213877]|uniref:YeeE/YedE family protein n=1 Tax=Tenacibaculum sp. IB213877 TaxID=3097351 RepID=UPI002A5A5866|nr:YeeE/YedE thiosulfate transporter family protein [Tenacibaculum sp. IB213877]MDY0781005.1 YeeE/YedE thiosulfate transporter family protein [Tenacibaculum sp. IB213877]